MMQKQSVLFYLFRYLHVSFSTCMFFWPLSLCVFHRENLHVDEIDSSSSSPLLFCVSVSLDLISYIAASIESELDIQSDFLCSAIRRYSFRLSSISSACILELEEHLFPHPPSSLFSSDCLHLCCLIHVYSFVRSVACR